MIRPDLFNAASADRYARWLTDEGADQGAVAREVAAWFTDLYGHPLTKREAADAREFLAMVTDRMEATR